jgi:hypothetical protein
MEMFLTLVALSLFATFVTAALFVAAVRRSSAVEEDTLQAAMPAPHFFANAPPPLVTQVPIELLLLQIERHVRLEEAAAESFVHRPSREVLHSRTASPLVH